MCGGKGRGGSDMGSQDSYTLIISPVRCLTKNRLKIRGKLNIRDGPRYGANGWELMGWGKR